MLLWLAWKTASRWGDLQDLRKENFLFDLPNNQVVIRWGKLKTNRRRRFAPTGLTVIQEDFHPEMTLSLLQRLVSRLRPGETLAGTWTTRAFRSWMQSIPEAAHLTAHSIKRGAIDRLFELAAQGLVDVRLIPLVAKHKDNLRQFPPSTIGYASCTINIARSLGSQNATKLL